MVLKQLLGYEQHGLTSIHIDNMLALKIINENMLPTEQTRHIDIQYFTIQDWREDSTIIMQHIPGIINPSNDLTKPLSNVLHESHFRCIMGH